MMLPFSFITAASDYQLASSRIVLTRNSPNATVQVTIPQETLRTDAPFETFRLVLNDALGIAPSNLFFRDTNIIIQDVGTYVSPTGNKECIAVCRDEGV